MHGFSDVTCESDCNACQWLQSWASSPTTQRSSQWRSCLWVTMSHAPASDWWDYNFALSLAPYGEWISIFFLCLLGMLRIKTYNPSPGKARGWGLWTWDQPGSYSKTLTQNENSQISRGTFSRSLSFYFYIMNHIYLLIHFLKFRYIFISFIFYINYLKHMELVRKVMNNKTENISNSRSALTVYSCHKVCRKVFLHTCCHLFL